MSPSEGSGPTGAQQRLPFEPVRVLDRGNFIASGCNAEARQALEAWRGWPGGKLALVGPEGAGKTHLALCWAREVGAGVIDGRDCAGEVARALRPLVIESADQATPAEAFFHLIDRAGAEAPLLMTARTAPRDWPAELPDLRSRLNALMAVELQGLDDAVLMGVLEQFFRDRNIRAGRPVIDFLVRRIERSAPAARAVVERLDEVAASGGRPITRVLAREVLGGEAPGEDPL